MRIIEVVQGAFLSTISLVGFVYSSSILSKAQNLLIQYVTSILLHHIEVDRNSHILQMSPDSIGLMIQILQYSFVSLFLIGIGLLIYGALAKKRANNKKLIL
jgi:hypothetical protein